MEFIDVVARKFHLQGTKFLQQVRAKRGWAYPVVSHWLGITASDGYVCGEYFSFEKYIHINKRSQGSPLSYDVV